MAYAPRPLPERTLTDAEAVDEIIASFSTGGIGRFKTPFPNAEIRSLMGMVWDIFGNRVVPTALGPDLPTLTFDVLGNRHDPKGIVFVPQAGGLLPGHPRLGSLAQPRIE